MGETLRMSKPGTVSVVAQISSPRPLKDFGLVLNGLRLETDIKQVVEKGIHKWVIEEAVELDNSSWIAAWGKGTHISAQKIDAMAHTNAIRVIIDGKPIRSGEDQAFFIDQLR